MPVRRFPSLTPIVWLLCLCCGLSSCASLITSTVIKPAVGNLQQQQDIELVCEGAPAYLLMLDSMLVSSPENQDLLLTATQSYSAYATALEECGGTDQRIDAIATKARFYGTNLLRTLLPLDSKRADINFDKNLAELTAGDVPKAFWGASGWLTWILRQKGSPKAIADIVLIEKIMARLLVLDESFQGGSVHLFFGAYHAAKPEMLGGRPDLSASHFNKALAISKRRFLLTHTTFAATLARMTMDRDLHDRLLQEVLAFPLESAPEFGLSNQIAVNRAKRLLKENYFED
ncbi:MAG: TRAP transporter TatT component family protein [Proteobacteria bacterium]|nr:TRAP transporter TatT component family protein [Pseudomonadota bacterium]